MKNHGYCDLKYAIELKKLGVKQESEWYWIKERDCDNKIVNIELKHHHNRACGDYCNCYCNSCYSAFTVAELGIILPSFINDKNQKEYNLRIYKFGKFWHVTYEWDDGYDGGFSVINIHDKSEANARAKMVIDLKKRGLLK